MFLLSWGGSEVILLNYPFYIVLEKAILEETLISRV